jgi:tetratricopeptide (TPR) repeat protein
MRAPVIALLLGSALLGSGCLRDVMVDETLAAARRASASAETLHDFEAARGLAYAGVGQLEGLHSMRPANADGLYLLTKAWVGVGQAFALDDYERALERNDDLDAEYHRLRARAAFQRAKFYGLELLELRAPGLSLHSHKQEPLRAWLKEHFTDPETADELLWLGIAWLSHVSVDTENSATISELWIGVELIEHVTRLDESVEYGMAHAILGGFHARTVMGEIEESKQHFERALALSRGRYLPVQLAWATRYHCITHDKASYERVLREILAARDPLPEARLANVVAKRRARRYLAHRVFQEECGFEL